METPFPRDNDKAEANPDPAIELVVLEEFGRCPTRPLTLVRLVAGRTGIPECRAHPIVP